MSQFLVINNIHLALELFGAIIFFVMAWLFFEGFLIKKDIFSFLRFFGFLLLSFWFIINAASSLGEKIPDWSVYTYLISLTLIFLSFALEKLPPRPDGFSAVFALPYGEIILKNSNVAAAILLFLISVVLFKRYFKDIDRLLKWLAIGFGFLTISSVLSIFTGSEMNYLTVTEYVFKLISFGMIIYWIWRWLSLRIREETLLVFVAISLFGAVLITTTFSVFFLKRVESDARNNLALNAQVFNFYLDSLKGKTLASAQFLSQNEELAAALYSRETKVLKRISEEFIKDSNLTFITFALSNGTILFKYNFPIKSGENILSESIGGEALRGRSTVTIDRVEVEGLSIRAATPVFYQGKIAGMIISGYLIDSSFVRQFRKLSNAEMTVFTGGKVIASSLWSAGDSFGNIKIEKEIGKAGVSIETIKVSGEEIIGAFSPILNTEGRQVASFSISTTPGELFQSAQATNRLIMLIVFIIILILVLPLYKFANLLVNPYSTEGIPPSISDNKGGNDTSKHSS